MPRTTDEPVDGATAVRLTRVQPCAALHMPHEHVHTGMEAPASERQKCDREDVAIIFAAHSDQRNSEGQGRRRLMRKHDGPSYSSEESGSVSGSL